MIKKSIKKLDNNLLNNIIKVKFLILFPIFLLHAWSLQYLNGGMPFDYVSRLSFKIEDQPWLPGNHIATPYFGRHYFGDLNLGVGFSTFSNPYDSSLTLPSQTPPIGTLFFRIFLLLGANNVLLTFLFLNLCALLIIFFLTISYKGLIRENGLYILLVTTSFPLLFLLDRGAVHLIVISLILCSLYFLAQANYPLFLLTSILACSIKPQSLIIVILFLIYFKKSRLSLNFLFLCLTTNLSALHIFFDGDLLFKFKSYLFASSFYSGGRGIGYIMDSTSLIGLCSRILEFFVGSDLTSQYLLKIDKFFMVPGLLYTLVLFVVLKSYRYDLWLMLGLILSTFSLVLPASMTYTLIWAIPALLLFSGEGPLTNKISSTFSFINIRSQDASVLFISAKVFYLLSIFYGLVFHLWSVKGPSGVERFPFGEILNPIFLSAALLLLLADIFTNRYFKGSREDSI